jgi:hypothetical protein
LVTEQLETLRQTIADFDQVEAEILERVRAETAGLWLWETQEAPDVP